MEAVHTWNEQGWGQFGSCLECATRIIDNGAKKKAYQYFAYSVPLSREDVARTVAFGDSAMHARWR